MFLAFVIRFTLYILIYYSSFINNIKEETFIPHSHGINLIPVLNLTLLASSPSLSFFLWNFFLLKHSHSHAHHKINILQLHSLEKSNYPAPTSSKIDESHWWLVHHPSVTHSLRQERNSQSIPCCLGWTRPESSCSSSFLFV